MAAKTTTERPALLNQREAARILGVSERTMRHLRHVGTLRPVRIPGLGAPRYRRADIEALFAEDPPT